MNDHTITMSTSPHVSIGSFMRQIKMKIGYIYQLKRKEDRRKCIWHAEKQRNMFFVSGRWEIWLAGSLHTFQKILPYNVWESKAKDIISKKFIHTFLSLWSCETKFNHLDGCIGWTECSEAPSVQFRQAPRSPWTRVGKITVLKKILSQKLI